MTDYTTSPTTLKRGMPKEQRNGLFGAGADRLLELGVDARVTAIVTLQVADIRTSEAEATRYPLVEFVQIEPLFDEGLAEQSRELQAAAYKDRTGSDQLDLDFDTALDEDGDEAEGEDA